MARLARRTFLGWLGALAAAIGARRGRAAPSHRDAGQPPSLAAGSLLALAQAVLPAELGPDGTAKAAREFSRWISEYRPGAELLHPYGSGEVTFAAASPLPTWRRQLTALETEARERFGKPWQSLGIPDRQALVRAALEGQRLGGMPVPLRAPHVAVALMSHWYDSAGATDLCYGVQIGVNQCRPLVHNARQPLPLARSGG
jgi:hypothetical protein